ncbi:MAG: penicillin-binding protein, partial [Parvimonas micra]
MKIFDKNKLEKINDRQLRYKIVYSILFILMIALVVKLFHLTIMNGDDYRDKADNNRLKDVKITAPRGNIYDRNGKLLAGVKTSPAVQILKDEFNRLNKDEKVSKIEELTRILNKDGASWDTDDYFLGINYFVYSSDVDYFTESKSPKEKVLDIILENKLVEDILKLRIEKNSSSKFSYYIIKKVIRDLQLKGIYVPSDFFDVDSGDISFSKDKKYEEYAKDKDLSKGIYSHVADLVKDDKSIIRKILDQPLARKLVYDELKKKNLLKNIELSPLVDLNRYNLLLIKSELNKQNSKVTLETSAKDDFYNMVRKFTMDKLLSYVKVDKKGNKIIPAEILLKKLEEKNIDTNVEYTLVKDEKDKEKVQFNYKDNEKKDIEPLTHLISLAEENNLLYDFVLSDDIKNIAQEVNTENNIILKISITNKSFDYVYNINRTEIMNRYKVKDDYTGESLFSTLKKTYSIEDLDDYTAYSYLVLNRKVELQGDKAYIPITLTYGISEPCVSHIKEKFENNKGFTVSMEPIRHYPNGELASHILGYIGKISQQDEIEKYTKDKGYSSDSFIGKTGVEESQEVSLKGQDGFKKVMVDNRGNRTETISETQAVPGKNVYLSIDSDLQKVAEE